MDTTVKATAHLISVYEHLATTYGIPQNTPDYNPLGGLVGTILSQHTSDINSGRAYNQLIAHFPTWEAVRDADTDQVALAIRCGGLANIKAPRIQIALDKLTEQQQQQGSKKALADYLYDELKKRTPEEGWLYLRQIPGVGPKTAACVMMFNMNEAVMPVDTHVHRTSVRLGLIGNRVSADKAHELFAKVLPTEWVYPLHVNLITHGRRVCHAQRPDCAHCSLYKECAYVGSVNAQETVISS